MTTASSRLVNRLKEEFARTAAIQTMVRGKELVRGEIITMMALPPRFRHGQIVGRTYGLLDQFVRPKKMGRVIVKTGMITGRDPDSVRGPDVTYWSADRLPLDQEPDIYPAVSADLCVEVLSPGETPSKI